MESGHRQLFFLSKHGWTFNALIKLLYFLPFCVCSIYFLSTFLNWFLEIFQMIILNVGLNVHKLYYRLCLRFSLCEEIFLACHVMSRAVGGAVAKVTDSENWLSWGQLLALTSPSLCTQHLFMCKHSGFLHPVCA